MKPKHVLFTLALLLGAVSCKEDETLDIRVETVPVTRIYYNPETDKTEVTVSARISGDISAVQEKGFIWSKEDPFATSKLLVPAEEDFEVTFDDLEKDKTYYVKAYVRTREKDFYGEYLSFVASTEVSLQDITDPVTDVMGTSVAARGQIVSDGGAEIESYGAYIGTSSAPFDRKVEGGALDGDGRFTVDIRSLTPEKPYVLTLYAENAHGESRTEPRSFSTKAITAPAARLDPEEPFSTVKGSTLTVHAAITDYGNDIDTRYGVKYGLDADALDKTVFGTELGETGQYTIPLTGLTPLTTYYVAAYAENTSGAFTGAPQSVQTINEGAPTVETSDLTRQTDYLDDRAVLKGRMTDDGSREITSYGFYIGTSANNMQKKEATGMDEEGNFTLSVEELTPNTRYYYRAYAVNTEESKASEPKTFQTGITDRDVYVRDASMNFTTERLVYWTLDPIPAEVNGTPVQLIFLDRNLGATKVAETPDFDNLATGGYYKWGSDEMQVSAAMAEGIKLNEKLPTVGGKPFNGWDAQPYYSESETVTWTSLYTAEPVKAKNPCPKGFHVPSRAEWHAAMLATGVSNEASYLSTFKICKTGSFKADGTLVVTHVARLWTDDGIMKGTIPQAECISSNNPTVQTQGLDRNFSATIRCVKDY